MPTLQEISKEHAKHIAELAFCTVLDKKIVELSSDWFLKTKGSFISIKDSRLNNRLSIQIENNGTISMYERVDDTSPWYDVIPTVNCFQIIEFLIKNNGNNILFRPNLTTSIEYSF